MSLMDTAPRYTAQPIRVPLVASLAAFLVAPFHRSRATATPAPTPDKWAIREQNYLRDLGAATDF